MQQTQHLAKAIRQIKHMQSAINYLKQASKQKLMKH